MCLGLPLKIIEINGSNAIGEMRGIRRNIRIDFLSDVQIDEYVMVHAGFAIEKMEMELAHETMDVILEINSLMAEEEQAKVKA